MASTSIPHEAATPNTTNTTRGVNFNDTVQEAEAPEPPKSPLYKSSRLKGYITLILASVIHYSAARNSASTAGQQAYAESVSLCSCLICIFIFLAHLDRFTPLRGVWEKAFGDRSICELLIILFLVLWWTLATAIITTIRGIAGDGREQFNLYYSTWCCCWTSYWTLERWLVSFGWASFKAFISSWPFRAPGWIAIFMVSFLTFMWYLDLYSNHVEGTLDDPNLAQHYAEVKDTQWQWLLFVSSATLLPSMVFVVIELFRETSTDLAMDSNNSSRTQRSLSFAIANHATQPPSPPAAPATPAPAVTRITMIPHRQNPLPEKGSISGGKGPLENVLEGICLLLLVLAWIPTVVVATTPGGAASLVGNAYFFTWVNTVFVMETFIWFVHDLRKGVHSALQVKEKEYQKRQHEVLQKSRALEAKRMAAGSWQNDAIDDIELDEIPETSRMQIPVIATKMDHHPTNHNNSSNNNNHHQSSSTQFNDWSSQEDDEPHSNTKNNIVTTLKARSKDTSALMQTDATQKQNNVRKRSSVIMDGEEQMPPVSNANANGTNVGSPDGSTYFFEAATDLDDLNDLPEDAL